ncbi:MAG: PilZ domain-containing protein [Pirellulales bacterium]|nr:PilZ domain-containing protein [Pirellulales bacterium]
MNAEPILDNPTASATPPQTQIAERRQAPRVPYDVMFQAAFSPEESPLRFVNVWGNNISPTGISFLSPQPPVCEKVVLRFGEHTQLFTRVCHRQVVDQDGHTAYLIGCEFLHGQK